MYWPRYFPTFALPRSDDTLLTKCLDCSWEDRSEIIAAISLSEKRLTDPLSHKAMDFPSQWISSQILQQEVSWRREISFALLSPSWRQQNKSPEIICSSHGDPSSLRRARSDYGILFLSYLPDHATWFIQKQTKGQSFNGCDSHHQQPSEFQPSSLLSCARCLILSLHH